MSGIQRRLEHGAHTLALLDRKRHETGSPVLGRDAEHEIVDRELRELEAEMLANPGALEKLLVRVRRR